MTCVNLDDLTFLARRQGEGVEQVTERVAVGLEHRLVMQDVAGLIVTAW